MKDLRPLTEEQLADVRRRIRNGVRTLSRAIEKGPTAEARRLFDHIFGPLQSESIQRSIAHLPASEQNRMLGFALKWRKESLSRVMSDHAKKPRPTRTAKYADRNRWIRHEYAAWKNTHPSNPFSEFHIFLEKGLARGEIKIPSDLLPQLYPNGELRYEMIRRIVCPL